MSRYRTSIAILCIGLALCAGFVPGTAALAVAIILVDDQEFYQLLDQDGISDDIQLFNEKLREWEGLLQLPSAIGALGSQTPYERLLAKTRAEVSPGS